MSCETIDNKFKTMSIEWSDMVEHMPTLKFYASQCPRVIELGVHDCTSTWGLLAGKPMWMRSYDIQRQPQVDEVEKATEDSGIDFKFILASSIEVELEPADLLFIDTYHGYDQLRKELEMHAGKVSKFILMHDTTLFGEADQDGRTPGLWLAIAQFISANADTWKIKDRFTNCCGLTVLERVST